MINLTKENIDKAIVNKGLNIVNLYQKGFKNITLLQLFLHPLMLILQ